MKSILFKKIVFLIVLAVLPISESLAAAGKFNFVIGDVSVVNASGSRKAVRGGEVEANESIVSGKDGMAQLRMSDGAFIAVRADTELRIDKYKFSGKADASSESVLSLVKGTFRAFTGAIASFNKDKFKMKTPSATIGIRGSGNVLNFSPVDNLTLNHTIEGSHVVTAFDPSGALRTLVTVPGQTVQINAVGAMQLVQTPAFILNAATGVPDSKPQQQPRQQQNQQPGAGEHGQAPGQGGAPGEGGGAAAGGPGMPGVPGMVAPGMMPKAGGMRTPGMPGMYAEGGEGAGDPAMTGRAPGQPGMYNPGMPGGAPAIDPVTGMPMAPAPGMYGAAPMSGMPGTYGAPMIDPATGMPMAPAPGMYGAAPMPGMYPPAPGMPGTYGAPMIDPATGMPMPPAPGMYGAAPMPGMYPPAAGMPYNDPSMMGGGAPMYGAAPMPGMYGAPAPMPGMYPPAAGMPGGMYNDPAMMGGGAPGMYGAAPMPGMYGTPAPMPGMYPPATGMPYSDPAMMGGGAPMYGAPAPMPGMYNPAMPGGMYNDPAMMGGGASGMYGAPAPMPGMYPAPAPGVYAPTPGMYTDPAMMGGMYPSAPMPGMYPAPAPGMYAPTPGMYTDPAMMGGMYPSAPMPGMYPAPAPGMYAPTSGMYTDPAMMGMYAPAPGMYNPAMPTGTTYTTYDPMTGMTMTTYVPPPTTYVAQYGYDAMGNLLPGYVLMNGIPTLQTSARYGYQFDFYGNEVLMPGFAVDLYGNAYPTGATSKFGFYSGGTLMPGFSMDSYGNAYPMGNPPSYGYTYDYYGNLVLAPGFTRDMYGNPVFGGAAAGAVGWLGGTCSGFTAPGGAYCDPATNTFMSVGGTTYVPGWLGGPCAGYSAPAGMFCDYTTNTFVMTGGGGAVTAGTLCYGYGMVSGSLFCNGSFWTTPAVGTPCTGAATVGALYCNGATWMAMTGGVTPGGGCAGSVGMTSGSLFCDGVTQTWITPAVSTACAPNGAVASGFTCSGNIWMYTGGGGTAVVGTACYSTGSVSGSLYCDGWYWMYPSQGGYCTGALTIGSLSCVANVWTSGAMAGTPCSSPGLTSGSLYCDGYSWITPAVGTFCYTPGATAGSFTCTNGMWSSNVAMIGGACAGVGAISGPYTCDGMYWVQQGSWCASIGATAGSLTCLANIWSFTGGATAGTGCSVPGTVSGSMYCDGAIMTWVTPAVNAPCGSPGLAVGGFTCSAGFWTISGGAVIGTACTGWGSMSGGFTCDGAVWVGEGSYCGSFGAVLGSLYCDATYMMWKTPVLGWACTGTAVVGAFQCNGAQWVAFGGGGTPVWGGSCTGQGGSVSGSLYCDGATWGTPMLGWTCTGSAGLMGMVCNAGVWGYPAFGTPGFATPLGGGMMYGAFGATPITMPATYKNIGFMYNLNGMNSFEIALNNTATVLPDMYGGLGSFQAPSVPGASSTNNIQLDQGLAMPLDFGTDFTTGMSWGRWQGGPVSEVLIGNMPSPNTSSTGSLHWFSTGMQTQAVTLPVTGTWNYALVGHTSPTDNTGVIGTLNSATFSANFSAQTVNVGLNVSVPASSASMAMPVTLNANAVSVPILAGGNFKTLAPTVSCAGSGCFSPTGSGVIGGQFSAPNGQGVGVGYGLVNGGQTVNGAAVFRQQ